MVDAHRVALTFPSDPEYLRLARLAASDAGSRAGFDFEEIDDLRIAVSELCTVISGAPGVAITLEFVLEPGTLAIEGTAAGGTLRANDFSSRILAAVVDEHEFSDHGGARFHMVKRARSAD